MKKIITVLMILILSISGTVNVWAENLSMAFEDVNPNAYYYDSIAYMNEQSIMTGRDAFCFAPDDYLQRQDLAVILGRYYTKTMNPQLNLSSSEANYYTESVDWVKKHHIMNGYEDGDFGVGDYVTRQDFIVALSNYAQEVVGYAFAGAYNKNPIIAQFVDCDNISEYAYISMLWQAECGVIKGYEINGIKFIDPQAPVTRGMAAVMLERYIERFGKDFNKWGKSFIE